MVEWNTKHLSPSLAVLIILLTFTCLGVCSCKGVCASGRVHLSMCTCFKVDSHEKGTTFSWHDDGD